MAHHFTICGQKCYTFTYPDDRIGEGSMATIYRAKSNEGGTVALKVLRSNNVKPVTLDLWNNNANFKFQHINLMQVYEEIDQNGKRHIVLEHINGLDYEKQFENIKIEDHLIIIKQILNGLKGLHQNSYIHRDIKPSNILIEKGQSLFTKIIDYDLVMHKDTKLDHFVGTLKYASPESINLDKIDERADVWSVGIILYRVFNNGRLPFNSETSSDILNEIKIGDLRHGNYGKYAKNIEAILNKCLAYNISNRYRNVDELYFDLGKYDEPGYWGRFLDILNENDLFSKYVKFTIIVLILIFISLLLILEL
ncbi:MAG: serine/threonine protein kinase [Saprospiraceae bacterium]|nr:serine/threonine protein kinase [Saprospiraceae bacterium]